MTRSEAFDILSILEELDPPAYDDKTNGPADNGSIIYVTGDGTDTEGLYQRQSGTYERLGVGGGIFADSGTNVDGGTVWQTGAEDEIDMQSGDVRSAWHITNHETTNQVAQANRPLVSVKPRTLYLDPVNGSDSVDLRNVTADNPLKTLNHALTLIPHFLLHEWTIDLTGATGISLPATYDSVTAISGPPMVLATWATPGVEPALHIVGDVSNPSNCVLNHDFINLAIKNAETDDEGSEAMLAGCEIGAIINNKAGELSIADCVFTGANGNAALQGKGGAVTTFHNTEFQDGLNHVADLGQAGAFVILRGCTGSVSEYTFDLEGGAVGFDYDSETIGKRGKFGLGSGGVGILRSGNVFGNSTREDWGDERFSKRRTDRYIQYRPTWNVNNGNPIPSDGVVQFPDGSTNVQEIEVGRRVPTNHPSTVDFDYQLESDPTTGNFDFEFIRASDNELWRIRILSSGSAELQKVDGGTVTTVLSYNYTDDQSTHSIRAERSDLDVWELFEDQSSQTGTTTDSYVPPIGSFGWEMQIRNTMDTSVLLGAFELGH